MSDNHWVAPGPTPAQAPAGPGWGAPPPAPPPGWAPVGAAHKPGAIPLRPLGLGDLYDGAFRIIRFNPRATVGSAALVSAVAMGLPVLVTAVLTWSVDLSLEQSGADMSDADVAGLVGAFGALGVGVVLQALGTLLVTGMIAHVAAAAAVGRRLSLGEAWAATRGRRWRLVGLSLLLGLLTLALVTAYVLTWVPVVVALEAGPTVVYGLVTVPAFGAFMTWFWIRVYYLPVPALMLEDVGVLGAVRRGFALTRRQFWRTLGIAALTLVVAQVAGSMLSMPVSLVAQLAALAAGPQYALLGIMLGQAVSSVVTASFVTPFTSAVTSLQYLDQRMRKEGYDVELVSRAGELAARPAG